MIRFFQSRVEMVFFSPAGTEDGICLLSSFFIYIKKLWGAGRGGEEWRIMKGMKSDPASSERASQESAQSRSSLLQQGGASEAVSEITGTWERPGFLVRSLQLSLGSFCQTPQKPFLKKIYYGRICQSKLLTLGFQIPVYE